MNTQRRLLIALVILLSNLFVIQPAGAVNAQATSPGNQLCGITEGLPETFPTWLEVQLRADDDCISAQADSLCGNAAPLPENFPTWIEKPTCSFVESGIDPVADAGPVCSNISMLPENFPTWIDVPDCAVVYVDDQTGGKDEIASEKSRESNVQDLGQLRSGQVGPTI